MNDKQRSILVGICILLLLLISSLLLSRNHSLQRLNLLIYDQLLPVQAPPMSDQIVIVDIDDASISELGRWPWSRKLHTGLLSQICQHQPRSIGFDILFSEPESTEVDTDFANAIKACGNVYLSVAPYQDTPDNPIHELLPTTELAIAAAGMGHVDAELDIDGLSRRFHLLAGIGTPHWRILPFAMTDLAIPASLHQRPEANSLSSGWARDRQGLVPYTMPNEQALRLSFSDVASGRINSPELFRDKYILVGATSSGIGDMISTPAYREHERMPGVELLAQVLNGLIQNQFLVEINSPHRYWVTVVVVLLGTLLIMFTPIRLGFLVTILVGVLVIAFSAALLAFRNQWYAPAASLFTLALAWPLWALWHLGIQERIHRNLHKRIEQLTQHNPLTNLPNQGQLEDQLNQLMHARKADRNAALIICHFNWPDSATGVLGRAQGDPMLLALSRQLQEINSDGHFLAHLTGDDFAYILHSPGTTQTAMDFADRIVQAFKQPLHSNQDNLLVAPNMGISIWPSDGLEAADLIRNAATAMFKARLLSDRQYCLYSEEIGQELQNRSELELGLQHALERDEFELYYQPQIDTSSREICGAEALIRWHNSKLGWVSPISFIPVAEHSGMISEIGDWVLGTACQQLRQLQQQGYKDFRMGINISPLQFCSPDLVQRITSIVQNSGADPNGLEFEITESTLMCNLDTAITAMQELREFGIAFSIDDFGTGYSSLNYLQTFPLTRLKLDQSFTREIGRNPNAAEITQSIINMARRLRMEVIAEGVEDKLQATFLEAHQCHELQGYLFSPPLPKKAFEKLLLRGLEPDQIDW